MTATATDRTQPATDALTDLVVTARIRRDAAYRAGSDDIGDSFDYTARTADAARTALVQEGVSYLATAWAVVDACRDAIVRDTLALDGR